MLKGVVKGLVDRGVIGEDEEVVFAATQRRLAKMVHPMSIIVTRKQIIVHKPRIRGHDIESHGFGRIQDILVKARFRSSEIHVVTWTGSFDFVGMKRKSAVGVLKAIREVAEIK
jgi:hypothetical protein